MMLDDMLDVINIAQLEMLGVRKEHLYISMLICGAILAAIIVYYFISLCLHYQWKYVSMYVVYSLSCLFLIRHPAIPMPVNISMETALKTISIIGWCFACYLFISKQQHKHKDV